MFSTFSFTFQGILEDTFVKGNFIIHTNIHTLMAMAAMQGADQHIRSSLGFQYLAQELFDMQTRETEPTTFQ